MPSGLPVDNLTALRSGRRGRRFESSPPDHDFSQVTDLVRMDDERLVDGIEDPRLDRR